jgi:hypothetical protein
LLLSVQALRRFSAAGSRSLKMEQSQIEALKQSFGGTMSEEQVATLRDMQAWIEFCVANGISFLAAVGTLAHDVNGILTYQDAKWFVPKTHGYSRIMSESPEQLSEMAREENEETQPR